MSIPGPVAATAPASLARGGSRNAISLADKTARASRSWDRAGIAAVALTVLAVTALRWRLLHAGPDLDGDSVGHALIGRRFLETPGDIGIHWVWLPLWHLVHALAAWLGGGLELVRRWNVALAAAPPFLLYATLRTRLARVQSTATATWCTAAERIVPPAAACVLALWPLEINLGESGQPEILFQTLLLLACLGWERDSRAGAATAGGALALASLLRYEAWLLPPVMLALWLLRRPRRAADALAWLLPGAAIVGWCALHRALTGEWMQFIRINHEYVAEALLKLHPVWRDGRSGIYTAGYYAAVIPFRSVGWLILLALPGAVWFARRGPRSHALVLLALLSFVTYGWLRRQHLGLARHFVALIPFYATMLAAGAGVGAAWLAERVRAQRPAARVPSPTAVAVTAALALALALVGFHVRLSARDLTALHARAFASERAAAAALVRAAAGGQPVFCDVSRVEVYSNLPGTRFVRDPLDARALARVRALAITRGGALVASVPARVAGLRAIADVLYEDAGSVVLRVPAAPAGP